MEVQEIRLGNALFNTRLEKSMFFVGEPIQICMKGKFTQDLGDLTNLQNSVHGDVQACGPCPAYTNCKQTADFFQKCKQMSIESLESYKIQT